MATASAIRIYHGTTTNATVDTITLTGGPFEIVIVENRDGADELYVRLDGTNPVTAAAENEVVPKIAGYNRTLDVQEAQAGGSTVVKVISAVATKYSVIGKIAG